MTTASTWLMTEGEAFGRGNYSRDIIGDVPYGVVDGTQRRDVSEALDLLALSETPFVNKIGWGPESGGTAIEWISEDYARYCCCYFVSYTSDRSKCNYFYLVGQFCVNGN